MNKIWMRLGIDLEITPEEAIILMEGAAYEGKSVIEKAIKDDRFSMNGETYIPKVSVEDYNRIYGTNFEICDYDFELCEEE